MYLGKRVLLATMLVISITSMAAAQDLAGKLALTPQIGLVMPTGDFSSTDEESAFEMTAGFATTGFAAGASLEYYVSANLAVGGSFIYNRFGFDTKEFEEPGVDFDAHWTVVQIGGHLKYLFMPDQPTRVFARAGITSGKPKAEVSASAGVISATGDIDVDMAMGFDLGLGLMHIFSENAGFFGEAVYTHLMTDDKDVELTLPTGTSTTKSAINTSWIGIKAGIVFFLGGK